MHIGKIEQLVNDTITGDGALLSVIIDPCDYPSAEKAAATGIAAVRAGADIIAIGGSIGAQGSLLDTVTKSIKDRTGAPAVLFPGNVATITPHADAIYFMTLLNSRNPYWISQAQTIAAPLIRQLRIEALPVGYIVVEPGGTVGWVGDANVVPRKKPKIAAALALAGQLSGHRIIFTDAGSAAFAPVPLDMVRDVSRVIDVPYLVAGGIRTPQQAAAIVKSGADWVQIGTAAERSKNPQALIAKFVREIKKAGKAKRS
ncbi:MAG: geranylgeranylglyceryl/heptaprenylglyceryl phosphate synthase [Candidatus Aenigmarchaeota archaeon]|nr:geranylgeranylglyceryl/heptaprenylglyceryl phosphate synthase [Candidatus Aenigmarchaeota archaeon]